MNTKAYGLLTVSADFPLGSGFVYSPKFLIWGGIVHWAKATIKDLVISIYVPILMIK